MSMRGCAIKSEKYCHESMFAKVMFPTEIGYTAAGCMFCSTDLTSLPRNRASSLMPGQFSSL